MFAQVHAVEMPQVVLAAITVLEAQNGGRWEEGGGEGMLSTGVWILKRNQVVAIAEVEPKSSWLEFKSIDSTEAPQF